MSALHQGCGMFKLNMMKTFQPDLGGVLAYTSHLRILPRGLCFSHGNFVYFPVIFHMTIYYIVKTLQRKENIKATSMKYQGFVTFLMFSLYSSSQGYKGW